VGKIPRKQRRRRAMQSARKMPTFLAVSTCGTKESELNFSGFSFFRFRRGGKKIIEEKLSSTKKRNL
jgi:hypothetical protein